MATSPDKKPSKIKKIFTFTSWLVGLWAPVKAIYDFTNHHLPDIGVHSNLSLFSELRMISFGVGQMACVWIVLLVVYGAIAFVPIMILFTFVSGVWKNQRYSDVTIYISCLTLVLYTTFDVIRAAVESHQNYFALPSYSTVSVDSVLYWIFTLFGGGILACAYLVIYASIKPPPLD